MIQQAEAKQSNLCFKECDTLAAMTAISKQLNETWKVSEEQREAWAEQMSDRFRAMCRHVQQARSRRRPPAWLESLELPKWESESRPSSAAAVVPEPRAATEEVKVAQWDHDLGKAYTVLPGASNCETNIFLFEFCMISFIHESSIE